MKTYMGVWVDHKKAFIATTTFGDFGPEAGEVEENVEVLESEVERRTRLHGGSRTGNTPWGPQDVSVDHKIEAKQKQQLKNFYSEIIAKTKSADKILIMGPGEAKLELKKQIDASAKDLVKRVKDVETCDKMTKAQVAARVREVFLKGRGGGR